MPHHTGLHDGLCLQVLFVVGEVQQAVLPTSLPAWGGKASRRQPVAHQGNRARRAVPADPISRQRQMQSEAPHLPSRRRTRRRLLKEHGLGGHCRDCLVVAVRELALRVQPGDVHHRLSALIFKQLVHQPYARPQVRLCSTSNSRGVQARLKVARMDSARHKHSRGRRSTIQAAEQTKENSSATSTRAAEGQGRAARTQSDQHA